MSAINTSEEYRPSYNPFEGSKIKWKVGQTRRFDSIWMAIVDAVDENGAVTSFKVVKISEVAEIMDKDIHRKRNVVIQRQGV